MNRTALKTLIAVATALVATAAWPQQPFNLDPNFRFNAQSKGIESILPLPDGDVIISGQIELPGEWPIERSGIRLHADGSLNTELTYGYMGGKITRWQDRFYCGNGQVIRRLLITGELDTSYIPMSHAPYFDMMQGGDYYVFPDGRVLVSGLHLLLDSVRGYVGLYGLIWFTAQGYLDTTRVHRRANAAIFTLFPLPDGKFLCSGYTSVFEGHALPSTAFRVLPDGTLDTTFQAPPGYMLIKSMFELPNGKLMVGGDPFVLDSGDTLNLMRLMPDGSRDPTFHIPVFRNYNPVSGWSPGAIVSNITPLDGDKYIITGVFTEVDGQPRGSIALIDTAGNLLDDLFAGDGCGGFQWDATTEYWGWLNGIAGITQAYDGSYYIYGAYHGYDDGTTNDASQRLISRLYGLNVGIQEQGGKTHQALTIFPNPSTGAPVLTANEPLTHAELYIHDGSGRLVWQVEWPAGAEQYTLPAGALAPGAYVVRVASRASATSATVVGHQGPGTETLMEQYTGRLVVMP